MSKTSNGITDLWVDAAGHKNSKHGTGRRYLARYLGPDRREVSKTFERKGDAALWLREQRNTIDRADWVNPQRAKVTVSEVHAEWWARKVPHLKPSTVATYDALWRNQIEPVFGSWRLDHLRRRHVAHWVADLVSGGLSASRTRQAHVVLTMILEHAVEEERLPRNPSVGVALPKLPHVDDSGRTALTGTQVDALADAVAVAQGEHQPQYKTLVLLLAYTGLRFGEAAALRVSDLDMLRKRVTVSKSVSDVNGRMIEGTPKTGKSRTVSIPEELLADLAAVCVGKGRADRLFTSPQGGLLRPSNFRRRYWIAAAKSIGKAGLVPHELRHTAASLAIASGATIKGVQNMLGHASAAMTLDRYGHLQDDSIDTLGEAMNRAILAARSGTTSDTGTLSAVSE